MCWTIPWPDCVIPWGLVISAGLPGNRQTVVSIFTSKFSTGKKISISFKKMLNCSFELYRDGKCINLHKPFTSHVSGCFICFPSIFHYSWHPKSSSKFIEPKCMTHSHPVISFFCFAIFPPSLPSLPSSFPTYVNVRCKLPTPADRCGRVNCLYFHTLPLPSTGEARGDTRGAAAAEGCLPQPLSRQPINTERWSRVPPSCCSAWGGVGGSRWSLVQVRGSS